MTVIELRQYVLRPGRRDDLVELFDREFVESQEALGMRVVGQFRDLDDADRFVWFRGFADMGTRLAGLRGFYGGPVWREHGTAANATMVDSDDVLLLRPVGAGFPAPRREAGGDSLVTVTVHPVASAAAEEALLGFLHEVEPVLADPGRTLVAELRTLAAVNDFPALPVREGEHVVVQVCRYPDAAAHAALVDRLESSPDWTETLRPRLRELRTGDPQTLRLRPTPRSALG